MSPQNEQIGKPQRLRLTKPIENSQKLKGLARTLTNPLHVPGKHGCRLLDIPDPECRENGAMIPIGWRLPFGSPSGEQQTGADHLQVIDGFQQARHAAWSEDQAVKASIRLVPRLHVGCPVAGAGGRFGRIENGSGEMRRRMTQRQHFQRRPHLRHFLYLIETETCDPHTATGLTDDKPLRFQPPKRLAYRHMTGTEFFGNVILPKPRPGGDRAGDNPLGKHSADTGGDRV